MTIPAECNEHTLAKKSPIEMPNASGPSAAALWNARRVKAQKLSEIAAFPLPLPQKTKGL